MNAKNKVKDKVIKTSKKQNKVVKVKNNKIPEVIIKLESESEDSYKIRKEFIENNVPKTKEEYKIIVSLSFVLVFKIFYNVKYSDEVENLLKKRIENMNLKKYGYYN